MAKSFFRVIAVALALTFAQAPLLNLWNLAVAEAGVVSKVAKFAAAKALIGAVRASTPAFRDLAKQKLIDMVRKDPLLLDHVKDVGVGLIRKHPGLAREIDGLVQAAASAARVDRVVKIPRNLYPEAAKHIDDAVEAGMPRAVDIARNLARQNRRDSLRGVPTKKGFDRDEFPPAMSSQGGKGASVRYIKPSDNRGAGSCVGAQCRDLPNGSRILLDTVD